MFRITVIAVIVAIANLVLSDETVTRRVTIDQPTQSANLQHAGIDVAMRYQFIEGQMEVIATFAGHGQPQEVVLRMDDGESLSFALPGQGGSLYSFTRQGDALTARVETKNFSDTARAG